MALTNEEILEAIASKTVLEISELIKMMEEKFGVSAAAAAVAVAAPAAGAAAAAEEKTPKLLPRSSKKPAPRSLSSNFYLI
mgnify:CR=1 FL=1